MLTPLRLSPVVDTPEASDNSESTLGLLMGRHNKDKKPNYSPVFTRSRSIESTQKQDPRMAATNDQKAETISDAVKALIQKTVENEIQSISSNLSMAVDNNESLKNQIRFLEKRLDLTEGLLQQAQIKLKSQNEKIIELQSRTMRDNLIIRGIADDPNESWAETEDKVIDFMRKELKIEDAHNSMVDRAHRLGKMTGEKPRNIVVKFASSKAKDKIFKNVKNLAGKKFSIQEQLPQEIQERRNRLWPKFREAKEKAKTDKSIRVKWSQDKLHINDKTYTYKDDAQCIIQSEVHTRLLDCKVEHSTQIHEQGSKFQGHAAKLTRTTSVADVLASLYADQSIASADHIIYAYRTKEGPDVVSACSDDGEHGAGNRLVQLLEEEQATDIIVICTRWFGGTHIGPKRFECIKNCSKEALQKIN